MATVTYAEMRDKLIPLDTIQERLATSEPLTTEFITGTSAVRFEFAPDWAATIGTVHDDTPVDARMFINGDEHQLTKHSAFAVGSEFGIPMAYARKVPTNLLEEQLNYWWSGGMANKEFNLLLTGNDGTVAALTTPSIKPFSNLQLLERVLEGIRLTYGDDVVADYKFSHSLRKTDLRLILPEWTRTIGGSGTDNDVWSAGLHLSNSLVGKSLTTIEGYLFRWWCTNGCTTNLEDVGTWSRKTDGQNDDVYTWARESVDQIFEGIEHRFDEVQALTDLPLGGNTADVLRQIFQQYNVPVSQRQGIIDNMLEAENPTMYQVMQSITQLANDSNLSAERADRLMRIGGNIPTATFDTVKAKVWREGHVATPEQPNPYEISAA